METPSFATPSSDKAEPPTASAVEALSALREALGERSHIVDESPEALEAARSDYSGHVAPGLPLCVVHAEQVTDVQAVMRVASAHAVPVVPRGAGTGLAGAANTGLGEISLSLARMQEIIEINAADQLAVVEPGILNAALNAALEPHGLWWAPDPASKNISSVGGNIATNAGGLLCAKYGVTREAVLSLDVVLANGDLITVGHRTVKGVTGLDLCALMIGSEGTLGVIVAATLKLRQLNTNPVVTIGAFFAEEVDAAKACAAITASRIQPAIMELVTRTPLRMLSEYTGEHLSARGNAFVLLQFDDITATASANAALSVLHSHGGNAELTTDPERSEFLVQVRRQVHFAMERFGTVLVEDVAVPRSRLPEMFEICEQAAARHGVTVATTAHAGDGNLHPCFVFEGETPSPEIWAAANDIFTGALSLGGTLTGEHGVGVLKRQWLGQELGARQLDLQRQIKGVFDPQGILNPGKVFQA
ncbi:FAD-binding oxidoreductase [Humidisolicoccus flavus]|uniref:FAD-binding oxidoreductase n=1 Tax=Humidisolicoccus flavus TaxID=3111414 RepID=UPI003246FA11